MHDMYYIHYYNNYGERKKRRRVDKAAQLFCARQKEQDFPEVTELRSVRRPGEENHQQAPSTNASENTYIAFFLQASIFNRLSYCINKLSYWKIVPYTGTYYHKPIVIL